MRRIFTPPAVLSLLAALGGCAGLAEPAGAFAAASAATVPVFGRSLPDMIYSGLSGQDCSIVRLEQGKTYCRAPEPPIAPAQVCSRSLGVPDCWANPDAFPVAPRPLADFARPTAEQEAYRTRKWPGLW